MIQSEPQTLPEGWQPGDICQLCSVILLRHSLGGKHRCPDVMNCTDTAGHVHGAGCWLASSFHSRAAAPLCTRCGRDCSKTDCISPMEQREENRDDFDY